uniref:Uncharacterized protein n=1 Tax=Bartonella rochalimae ATCC BAA-1498 TaxID=685782 RepID=E6YN13_9HYPH|nr:hypothetical protein BARRO_120013 [Bartonella rochalimae ATCC BAA-1498]CBI78270.1 hypothetical protein BARRO_120038 [Bartonella rochalimae ATCC BAA-1498]CBI78288.1 hypothetical protein BARRO_120062 [Bartonella rochalimae ATCC BAA-1498]
MPPTFLFLLSSLVKEQTVFSLFKRKKTIYPNVQKENLSIVQIAVYMASIKPENKNSTQPR